MASPPSTTSHPWFSNCSRPSPINATRKRAPVKLGNVEKLGEFFVSLAVPNAVEFHIVHAAPTHDGRERFGWLRGARLARRRGRSAERSGSIVVPPSESSILHVGRSASRR